MSALVIATPSHAATATAGPVSVFDVNGQCRFSTSFQVTGTTSDNSQNRDFVTGVLRNQTGVLLSRQLDSFVVGTTGPFQYNSIFPSNGRGTWRIELQDNTLTSGVLSNGGPVLVSVPITRNALIAAGDGCADRATNQAPVANAGPDQSVNAPANAGSTVNLSGSASDPDGDGFTVLWTQVSGPSANISSASTVATSVDLPQLSQPTDFVFEIAVTDVLGVTTLDTVTINSRPPNTAPVAFAGADQTLQANQVYLVADATATDVDGDALTYEWQLWNGSPLFTIQDPTSLNPTITAPPRSNAGRSAQYRLRVSDGTTATTSFVLFQVPFNQRPVAEAGPDQTAAPGDTVTLDGTGSTDPENDPLTYIWSINQTSGAALSGLTLNNPNSAMPTFVVPANAQAGDFVTVRVRVDDGLRDSNNFELVRINIVAPANAAPVVNAGPDQSVAGGDTVTLAGTASDADSDPLTTTWVQTGGPTVTLSDPSALNPTFTAPARAANARTVTFELRADDGTVVTIDSVDIVVAANQAPIAVASPPQNVVGNQTVTLDGTASSDPDGDALIYQWTQVSGPPVTISSANTPTATFVSAASTSGSQSYSFRLLVADPFDASDTATTIIEQAANGSPIADAGVDQDAIGSAVVTLDGSGSTDPEGDTLFYSWVQQSGPPVTLSDSTVINPTFTAPAATGQDQPIEFELTVTDRTKSSQLDPAQLDTVIVNVIANRPPVADAGADQGPIDSGQTVTLDGTSSTDPDGDALFYEWTQVSGTPVTLSDPNAAQPTFTAPTVAGSEDLEFNLTVRDMAGAGRTSPQQSDTVVVGIQAVGSITLIQQVTGRDTQVAFTSDLAALNASLTTSGGTGQISVTSVAAGSYSVTAPDLSAQGYVITDITCNDTDSVASLANRSIALELSASEDLVCTFTTANSREAATAAINNFLTGRNALILSHQPDLQRRLDRLSDQPSGGGGPVTAYGVPIPGSDKLPVTANISRASSSVSTNLSMLGGGTDGGRIFDMWGEAYFSRADIGQQEGDFSILYFGADLKLSDGLLVGALVQKDDFSDRGELEAGEADGEGWMAGPYMTARLGPQLYAEARAAWGQSDNRVSPLAGQVDDFDTSRSYYSGSLIGQFDIGDVTTFRPELTVRYFSENQKAYTDANGVNIPSQIVDQGDISFRPRLSHLVKMDSGWGIRPFAEVEGIYTFGTEPDAALSNVLPVGFAPTLGEFRGRVEGGLDLTSSGSFRATLSGFYDGIGADDFSAKGVHVGVSFGF